MFQLSTVQMPQLHCNKVQILQHSEYFTHNALQFDVSTFAFASINFFDLFTLVHDAYARQTERGLCCGSVSNQSASVCHKRRFIARSSANPEGPCNAVCQLKSCQLLQRYMKNHISKGRNRCTTLKITQGHQKWCNSIGHVTSLTSGL